MNTGCATLLAVPRRGALRAGPFGQRCRAHARRNARFIVPCRASDVHVRVRHLRRIQSRFCVQLCAYPPGLKTPG